jgi:hypothetical protein
MFDFWTGGLVDQDPDGWTLQQRQYLERMHQRPRGSVNIGVRRPHPQNWMMNQTTYYACPLLAETATGRLVVTPSGHKRWIDKKGPYK